MPCQCSTVPYNATDSKSNKMKTREIFNTMICKKTNKKMETMEEIFFNGHANFFGEVLKEIENCIQYETRFIPFYFIVCYSQTLLICQFYLKLLDLFVV